MTDTQDGSPFKLTPMFEQFFFFKKEYPDCLLFFRMGDFYELFFDDAELAARELQIALTSRNSHAEHPVPMCGVPHNSAESYLRRLNEKGYKVAICEQVGDPKAAKGLVKREVTEVRTPGTTLDDASLEAKGHNYLGALYWDARQGRGGFAWLDFSTGTWSGLHSRRESELRQWVGKMRPRELLLPDPPAGDIFLPGGLEGTTPVRVPARSYFDPQAARERLFAAQSVRDLDALGLEGKEELVRACGALLAYLVQTQKQEPAPLSPFVPLNLQRHLILDEITERNLEIFRRLDGKKGPGTLLQILDETVTPMGGRLLEERLRHPWREAAAIRDCAEVVDFFHSREQRRRVLRLALRAVSDLERLIARICARRASPRDYVALRQGLGGLPAVLQALRAPAGDLSARAGEEPPGLRRLLEHWDGLEDLHDLLLRALTDSPPLQSSEGGVFRQGYDRELDALIDLSEHGVNLLEELLREEQRKTGLARMKLGFNRVFGYYLEVPKSQAASMPATFIRRQTVANAERFVTAELSALEEKILSAREERGRLELRLFSGLRETVAAERPRIAFMSGVLAGLDYWQSLAETARKRRWARPLVLEEGGIFIREGRHPVVEALAGPAGFVPNDLRLDEKSRLLLITGPNMAGKSTVLRQTALIVLLAQMGGFVPASEARLGLVDRIFSRVGASDNLAQGQSTFMVEMMETARILRQATRRSLVILDEIGRGTSTFDGLALAWAVVEELARRAEGSIRTLFATHYHELTALEGRLAGVRNMNVAVTEAQGEILFTRRLVPGPADKSYGIEVARLAGVPPGVVRRARCILERLDASRASGDGPPAGRSAQALLPGMEDPSPPSQAEHPLLACLRDLDTDNLPPWRALSLLSEWKQRWGKPLPGNRGQTGRTRA
ncbi:MAG: DNA mismatch repair protein MutS [Desulfovibrio sp.]|jgi:DNA mismatch repair protein MutS|nr:DNA mismatch repair protein MutS [Desulfovibrio sp.]